MNDVSFTRTARRAVQAAREEATRLFHPVVGTEHILLGVLRHDECDARVILDRLSIDAGTLRRLLEDRAPPGDSEASQSSDLSFAKEAKTVLEQALVVCRELGQGHLGTGHLLLGVLRAERGVAAESLREAGVTPEGIIEHLPPTGSCEPLPGPSGRTPVMVTIQIEHRDGTTSTETFPTAFAAVRYLFDLARDTE